MLIEHFEILNDIEKEELVLNYGIFLATYDDGNDLCNAYQLCEFYVAFCFDLNKNQAAKITVHKNPDDLPHLLKINNILT